MATKHEALGMFMATYDARRRGTKFDKSEAVRKLAAFGLFTAPELAALLGCSVGFVENIVGERMPQSTRHWKLSAIDALYSIAWCYEHKIYVMDLVKTTVKAGNSVKAVAELTGVPKDIIREALLDEDGMGILGTGAKSQSV